MTLASVSMLGYFLAYSFLRLCIYIGEREGMMGAQIDQMDKYGRVFSVLRAIYLTRIIVGEERTFTFKCLIKCNGRAKHH